MSAEFEYGGKDGAVWGRKEWGRLKLGELRDALSERSLANGGKKGELIERLLSHDNDESDASADECSEEDDGELGLNAALSHAENLEKNTLASGTERGYICKMNQYARFLKHHDRADLLDEDGLPTVPVDESLTVSFLGDFANVRDVGTEHPVFGWPS